MHAYMLSAGKPVVATEFGRYAPGGVVRALKHVPPSDIHDAWLFKHVVSLHVGFILCVDCACMDHIHASGG